MKSGPGNQKTLKPRSDDGFILVVVLWILAALAALASTYSIYLGNAAFATQINDDRLRIRNAISTGIELSAYQLLAEPEQGPTVTRRLHGSVGAGDYRREFCF